MAYYTGYVDVPHSSYDEWKNNTLNNFYNIDGSYGCQCWDFASLFWRNLGFPANYPIITASSAYTMWENRLANSILNGQRMFDLITNLDDIKKGDVIVYNYFSLNPYGHVGFADEDYATWHANNPSSYEFPILSENNGGTPDPAGGAAVNVHGYDTRLFLGAFRYVGWETTPTPTTRKPTRKRFPWVLYANKLRNKY